jgi:GMP synthase (glutamine-hydrolysing)
MIVNNGTHFLAEIREALEQLQVECEMIPGYGSLTDTSWQDYSGVILTGGEIHVNRPEQLAGVAVDEALLGGALAPILGICLGHQLIAHHYGAEIAPLPHPVDQDETVEVDRPDVLFNDVPSQFRARVAHDDAVVTLPKPLVQLASSRFGKYEAIRHHSRLIFGVQFHPEASGRHGLSILSNFAALCGETHGSSRT